MREYEQWELQTIFIVAAYELGREDQAQYTPDKQQ